MYFLVDSLNLLSMVLSNPVYCPNKGYLDPQFVYLLNFGLLTIADERRIGVK